MNRLELVLMLVGCIFAMVSIIAFERRRFSKMTPEEQKDYIKSVRIAEDWANGTGAFACTCSNCKSGGPFLTCQKVDFS